MTPKRHALAMARLVVAGIDSETTRGHRRLHGSRLRCAAERPDVEIAAELGVLARVDAARDAHLATLDAEGGLAALCVSWEVVVAEAVALLDGPRARNCPRCGARLSLRRPVCGRCRSPGPR